MANTTSGGTRSAQLIVRTGAFGLAMALLASACGGGQDPDLDLSLSALDTESIPTDLSIPEGQTGEQAIAGVPSSTSDDDGALAGGQTDLPADDAGIAEKLSTTAPAAPAPPTTPALVVDDGSATADTPVLTTAPPTTAAAVAAAPTTAAKPAATVKPAPTTAKPTTAAPTTAKPTPGDVGNLPNGNATNIQTGAQFKMGDYLAANGNTPILFWLWQPN